MNKKPSPRLSLHRQTVRKLDGATMRGAVGGRAPVTSVLPYVCNTVFCSALDSGCCDPPVTWYGCPID